MIWLHIFTEEPSIKEVFDNIIPKIVPGLNFSIYPHQGKQDLEKGLKNTLPSISKMPGAKILITRDQDNDNCIELKNYLNEIVKEKCSCDYKIRIVCRELEAWFLGDMLAIDDAYLRFNSQQYKNKSEYRNVDNIVKPSQQLLKIIPEYSKYESLPKIELANRVSHFLTIEANQSSSFQQTVSAIKLLSVPI